MRSVLRKTGTGLARGTYLELIRFFGGGLCHRKWSVLFPLEFQRINQKNTLGRVHAMPSFANG